MNIKEYRNFFKLSQREFADRFQINLRTLQDYEQGRTNPPSYLLQYLTLEANNHIGDKLVEYVSSYKDTFKICIKNPFLNCNKIYPIQQRKVKIVLDYLKDKNNIEKVIVFGSSTSYRCHSGSDLDLYVELESGDIKRPLDIDFDLDFWTSNSVDERLKKEIYKTGVIVYERSKYNARQGHRQS